MVMDDLKAASEAVRQRDVDRALACLRSVYATAAFEAVADAIRKLDLTTSVPRAPTHWRKADQDAWLKRAENATASDIGALSRTMMTNRREATVARFRALLQHCPDPRISDGIVALVKAQRHTNPPRVLWETLRDEIPEAADPALAAALRECPGTFSTTLFIFSKAVPELERRYPNGPPEPTPAEQKVLADLRAAIDRVPIGRSGRRRALFEEVYANPEDDQPRHALADFLVEEGDPLGEFILLQLAGNPASKEREASLLREHRKAWLAPFGTNVKKVEFRRGFPAKAEWVPRACGKLSREWRTIEDLTLRYHDYLQPNLEHLRAIHGDSRHVVRALLASGPWELELIVIALPDERERQALFHCGNLPRLKHLAFRGVSSEDEDEVRRSFEASPLGKRAKLTMTPIEG